MQLYALSLRRNGEINSLHVSTGRTLSTSRLVHNPSYIALASIHRNVWRFLGHSWGHSEGLCPRRVHGSFGIS